MDLPIKEWFSKLETLFEGLDKPFKIISAFLSLLVVFVIWYIFSSTLFSNIDANEKKIRNLKKEEKTFTESIEKFKKTATDKKKVGLKNEKSSKEKILKQLEKEVAQYKAASISEKSLFMILRGLVDEVKGVDLLQFQHSPKKLLLTSSAGLFYRDPIEITLKGNYNSIYTYLKKVESKDINLYWQKLDYKVQSYPLAIVEVYYNLLSATTKKESDISRDKAKNKTKKKTKSKKK